MLRTATQNAVLVLESVMSGEMFSRETYSYRCAVRKKLFLSWLLRISFEKLVTVRAICWEQMHIIQSCERLL